MDVVNSDTIDKDGRSRLIWATIRGHIQDMKVLLQCGADVNLKDKLNCTALHFAATLGPSESVALLLKSPCINATTKDKNGWTALHLASITGQWRCVAVLVNHPTVDVNAEDNNGWTPLHLAAVKNQKKCIKYLLRHSSIQPNKKDENGWAPIHLTAIQGHSDCLKLLINHQKIDINGSANGGYTALMLAASIGHFKCVNYLLQQPGIDVSKTDHSGWITLHYAVKCNSSKCVEALLNARDGTLNIDAKDHKGYTPLMQSAMAGEFDNYVLLLERGGDINLTDNNQSTLLFHAAKGGNRKIIDDLIKKGFDINRKNLCGQAPIFSSVENDDAKGLNTLIKNNVKLDIRDEDGMNVLMWAAKHGSGNCVLRLIKIVHNLKEVNLFGQTALECSKKGSTAASILRIAGGEIDECIVCCGLKDPCTMTMAILGCSHTFHSECINKWVHCHDNKTCPICRQLVLYPYPITMAFPAASSGGECSFSDYNRIKLRYQLAKFDGFDITGHYSPPIDK